jgi:DNA-binding response OmpR family regulator
VCLYVSGHADEVLGPRGLVHEGVNLLRKPFTIDELTERVRSILDRERPSVASSHPPPV